jgi:hypothetical protein
MARISLVLMRALLLLSAPKIFPPTAIISSRGIIFIKVEHVLRQMEDFYDLANGPCEACMRRPVEKSIFVGIVAQIYYSMYATKEVYCEHVSIQCGLISCIRTAGVHDHE